MKHPESWARIMVVPVIDLNADLGESFGRWTLGDDASLIEVISSANVACGFHAGDPSTLRRSCQLAVGAGVAIGAQVAYRDLAGFGRRFIDVAPGELRDDVLYQLGALDGFARTAGGRVTYLKPHGALYHAVVGNEGQAKAVVDAVHSFDPTLAVLGQPGSLLLKEAAAAGLRAVPEAFADRQYTADGGLLSRSLPGAVLTDEAVIAEQVRRLVTGEGVVADDGSIVPVTAESICVHGDTPGAVRIARVVRDTVEASASGVRAFTNVSS
ncbi:LamB/YcsF family protein [Kineosporia sp. J2-2]|uniref:5-oxoprolinase subunit A n=1 Tax=Kineosporia corallincola TaxID=2835133 RepID=A0ABS5TJQ4_9ACTN|nr:5-oxoprolinase subunit PxpA [Kineosporia corallincola]MBT0771312.1 LamB/YcsF family protein [Kineosporia corallincola]